MAGLVKLSKSIAAIRDLVEAAEEAGWDITENKNILDRGRDAYAMLQKTAVMTETVTTTQPVLVPTEYRAELSQLPKEELMDAAWRLSSYDAGSSYDEPFTIMMRIRIAVWHAQERQEAKK